MTWQGLITMSLGAILIENFVLVRFLGICPFLGVSKKMDTAMGMGMAVIFVMTAASAATWAVDAYLLKPFGIEYMETVAFILVIAALVQIVEMFLQKAVPALYKALGIYLPLITTNCAVLGVAIINSDLGSGFLESVLFSFLSGVGFTFALLLFAAIRQRLEFAEYPDAFEGFPIALVTAGLLAMCFMGFSGLEIFP
ncbi:MAG: electron transport complex subunit RsxA [Oscillospiraceae bacterium]|jgi:electron transport complex protein RnfA|nr:electron transport complex subunit RsxA [Oscillospiraceae bacterium]